MIEVTTEDIVVDIVNNIDVSSTGSVEVVVEDSKDLDITVAKKEFIITGDDIYVPVLYDDAPQWMKDLVEIAVAVSVETANTATLNQLTQILSEFATSYVPLNQYTQSILDLSDADERIHTLITTLNSNYNDGLSEANSQIIHLESTKASRTEVVAQVVDTIAAQLATPGSDIQSVIARLDQAIVTETQARAQSFQVLTSSLNNVGSDVTANANAIHSLNTYVGVSNGVPDGSGALADIVILQKQNDGVIETVTGTYDVMINPQDPNLAELVLTAEPYKTWKAADVTGMDTRLKHIGDVYIKYSVTSNGAREYVGSYKFIRTIVDASDAHKSTDADGFTWALIVDQAAQDAYNQALNAYDLADNKRRVFTTTPSGPYDIGDLWTKTVSGGSTLYKATVKRVSGYVAGDWVVADDAGLNVFVSSTYTPTITSLQNQIDGKIESWYTASTSDPKTAWTDAATRAKHDGDLWYQTDTKLSYYYSSSTNIWNLIDDAKAIQALANAATAQATADGKITSYYMATLASAQSMSTAWTALEKTNNVGDLVVIYNDTTLDNNGTWRWNGTSWETTRDKKLVSLASDVTTLSTNLQNGTGTWATGDSNVTNALTTTINNKVATVESKWAYNSNLSIDGVSYNSGFGLATSVNSPGNGIAVGDSEFWINANKFRFTNTAKTGSASPFTIDASGPQPQVTFNGKVTFGSGQTGTIDQAIAAVVETVSVGDKNINITDNLIPVTSLVADTDNSGYQFVGTPTKSISSGLESFSETQIVLDGTDEVYSPYVDEVTIPYYYRFGIKGITSLSVFKIVTINTSNVITYNTVTVTMEPGQALNANNWYTVDGIINPVGGTTSADGDVRDSSGFKVGSVNNFAIASGSSKILLGWIANCTISRMKMCKITADTITSDFSSVNGQLVSLQSQVNDVSWNTLNGKDVFAQKLGYSTYAELETAATAGQTVIVGGHVNTNLIQANGIAASQINTTGLIADNIRANEIVGKTITGGVLNGAAINGAVIKASYIDLDGQLQVLTNYHISVAMYNSNPGLYTDAVYISGTNEYRIPSISTVRESTVNYVTNSVATYYGAISSYNTANAGNNLKAVKIRPIWNNQTQFQLFNSVCSDTWFGPGMYYGTHNRFIFRLGSVTLIEYKVDLVANGGSGNDDTTVITITGQNFSPIIVSVMSAQFPEYSNSYTVDIGIATVSLSISVINSIKSGFDPAPYPNKVKITGMLLSGSRETAFDWTNGKLQFDQIVAPSITIADNFEYTSIYGSTTFALNQSLSINNMI